MESKIADDFLFSLATILLGLSYSPALLVFKKRKKLGGIAGKLGPEPETWPIYKLLIEENTSMTATVKLNFGKQAFIVSKKGDIDIYPEFTGTVIRKFASAITQGRS